MKHVVGIAVLFLLRIVFLQGQNLKLESLTIDDGLSQGMIFDVLQDRDGFLWVATKDGINRYDGYTFKAFGHSTADPYSLSGHVASVLFEDSRGWLWIGTENNGVNLFDKKTERFYHLESEGANRSTLQSNNISTIAEDAAGDIWVGTEVGADRVIIPKGFDPRSCPTDALNAFLTVKRELENFGKVNCVRLLNGRLLIGTNTGLYEKTASGQHGFRDLLKGTDIRFPPELGGVGDVFEDRFGALWLLRLRGVTRVSEGKTRDFRVPLPLHFPGIRATMDASGNFLIGYSKLQYLTVGPQGIESSKDIINFADFSCTRLHIDRTGVIWIGTNGFGLRKYNPRISDFHHLMPGASIQQVFEDQQQHLWVWTNFNLLWLDPKTGMTRAPEGIPEDLCRTRQVFQDSKGRYWFHIPFQERGKKIVCFDPVTRKQTPYPYTPVEDPLAPFLEDREGNIWIGCLSGMVMKLDIRLGKFVYYNFNHLFSQNDIRLKVVCLYQAKDGVFWMGTPLGLVRMADRAGKAPEFKLFQSTPGGLSENYILSILEDPKTDGLFWIGTKGGGLNRFDTRRNEFTCVSTKDGLPNNVVYGILYENTAAGMDLWLSTNRGLSCYNPQNRTFKNYLAADGLQDNEFNTSVYCKTQSGELVFGGINGINIFRSEQIRGNAIAPPVFLTDIRVNNEPVALADGTILNQVIEFTRNIRLRYDQNMLALGFSVLDFAAPEKNTYEYQMVGLESDWVKAGGRREVVYTNLPPGHYTFRVKGANSSGVWSEKPAEITITVLPPWWRTTWAWGLWIGLAATLLYLLYRFQINRIRLRNQLQFEQKEAERLADIDRMKTDFFSNITHEFRTPLTLILEPLRQALPHLKEEQVREKVVLAEKNGQQLLGLVNQLLDLSKLESGAMRLDLRNGNFRELIQNVFQGFLPLAEKKSIRLKLHITDHFPEFHFDKGKIELILNNLISNALKFTKPDGRVEVAVEAPQRPANDQRKMPEVNIQVTDNGIGIPAEALPRIFDRFYQVDSSHTRKAEGTGIGLALTKELVELMGGTIEVDSKPEMGTTFRVRLPMIGLVEETTVQTAGAVEDVAYGTPVEDAGNETEAVMADGEPMILIIEDHEDLRQFIRQSIGDHYRVVEAADGGEGIQKALELVPDLIISDLMMPVKDGYAVCDELKNNELTSHIPIILLTAKSDMDNKLRGLRTGADDYLTKPFHTEELLVRMKNLIETRRLLRQKYSTAALAGEATTDETTTDKGASATFSKIDHEFLRKITGLLEDQLEDENLSVEEVARQLYISRVQLHRKLKALTDQPANEFIRNYRLDRALEMLKNKEGNVTEIAIRTGFGSQKYFSVRFKERFGLSPSEVA